MSSWQLHELAFGEPLVLVGDVGTGAKSWEAGGRGGNALAAKVRRKVVLKCRGHPSRPRFGVAECALTTGGEGGPRTGHLLSDSY